MSEIGKFLRKLREERNYTFRQAAEKSGLSHSYIRYLEEGKRPGSNTPINPTPETIKRLADAYRYDYEELMKKAGYLEKDSTTTNDQAMNDVIKDYDRLPQHKKKLVDDIIRELLDEGS